MPPKLAMRSPLSERPICSPSVKPAPGTCSSASFSSGLRAMRYSPLPVGSTNSISIPEPTPPKQLFDNAFPLLVGLHFLEGFTLFVRNDVRDVLVEPILVGLL